MKQRLLFLLWALSITFVWAADMLWEVRTPTGSTVYLLGSIHVGKPQLFPLSSTIEEAFEKSDYLVLEILLDDATTVAMQEALLDDARLESNDTLSNHLDVEHYAVLQERLRTLGLEGKSMDGFAPWAAGVMLESVHIMALGYTPTHGIDMYFWRKAQQHNKSTYALESAGQQIAFLREGNATYQEELMAMILEETNATRSDYEKLFGAWQEGDADFFSEEILTPMRTYASVEEILLKARNSKMTQKINRYLNNKKGQNYFVIVGLAHLLGEDGIIAQLQNEGKTVIDYTLKKRSDDNSTNF
ncbi:MAG: hypothetical protein KU37_02710 [Sulfuricurvum sp. PC08-66]|nr:MAG: hypothetical protein KU37_02710 [Sulfuricurvum sp. PC08-66]